MRMKGDMLACAVTGTRPTRVGGVVDNMAGLDSEARKNAGALRPLLDDVVMGMDPEEGIEDAYKVSCSRMRSAASTLVSAAAPTKAG